MQQLFIYHDLVFKDLINVLWNWEKQKLTWKQGGGAENVWGIEGGGGGGGSITGGGGGGARIWSSNGDKESSETSSIFTDSSLDFL